MRPPGVVPRTWRTRSHAARRLATGQSIRPAVFDVRCAPDRRRAAAGAPSAQARQCVHRVGVASSRRYRTRSKDREHLPRLLTHFPVRSNYSTGPVASWFETAQERLLTMRSFRLLILRRRCAMRSKDGCASVASCSRRTGVSQHESNRGERARDFPRRRESAVSKDVAIERRVKTEPICRYKLVPSARRC